MDRATRLDGRIAAGLVATYLVLSLVLLPAGEYPRAIGAALLIFGLIVGVARWAGRGRVPGFSVMFVGMAAAAVLAVPTFPAMGGTVRAAVPLGFVGSQAAAILWAVLRSEPSPRGRRVGLLDAWVFGLGAALLLSLVASIPIVLALVKDDAPMSILLVYGAYGAGALGAATVYWLLQPVEHLATGRYLTGVLGGACMYGACMPLISVVDGEPLRLGEMALIALLIGAFVGPAVAFGMRSDD